MSKSALRKEYEAVFGVVDGSLRLYDAKGNLIYIEHSDGHWFKHKYYAEGRIMCGEDSDGESCKYQYNARGKMIYYESSVNGVMLDKRPCAGKVFIDDKTGKKFKMTEIK